MPSAKIHAIGQETVRWRRIINEKGSDRVEAILASASGLAVSVICVPEIVSVRYRRRRESKLSTQQYRNAKAALLSDIDDATIIGMTEELIAQAVALLVRSANMISCAVSTRS
jgi:hypothetical protein